jgi:hypothetical protein
LWRFTTRAKICGASIRSAEVTALEPFRAAMADAHAPSDPNEIGPLLGACVRHACAAAGLDDAEILDGGPLVTMFLSPTSAWEAVIVGPDAYQFYPGFVRGESITWANVWVADNYDRRKFIACVEQEIAAACVEKERT